MRNVVWYRPADTAARSVCHAGAGIPAPLPPNWISASENARTCSPRVKWSSEKRVGDMGTTSREDEREGEDQEVPEGALEGVRDVVDGRLATKEELADVLKF